MIGRPMSILLLSHPAMLKSFAANDAIAPVLWTETIQANPGVTPVSCL